MPTTIFYSEDLSQTFYCNFTQNFCMKRIRKSLKLQKNNTLIFNEKNQSCLKRKFIKGRKNNFKMEKYDEKKVPSRYKPNKAERSS